MEEATRLADQAYVMQEFLRECGAGVDEDPSSLPVTEDFSTQFKAMALLSKPALSMVLPEPCPEPPGGALEAALEGGLRVHGGGSPSDRG